MTDQNRPNKDFEDLPKELQDVVVLSKLYRKSILLTAAFGSVSAFGWSHLHNMRSELKVNPAAYTRTQETTMGITALCGTGLTVLGVAAIIKMRRLIRQGEDTKNRKDTSGPSL